MVCASGWQGRCGHFLALSSALIAGLALAGCRAEGVDGPVVAAQELVPVRVAEVAAADQAEMLHFAGSARARQRASLTFQVGGTLASRPLQLGQAVAAGDVLATLYNPQLEPARDAARARLAELQVQAAQARRDLQRTEQLFQRGALSKADQEQQAARLEALQAGVRSARASLQQSERLNSETRMRAPFDGTIEDLLVEPGEFVAAGQPVLQMAASGGAEVEVLVPAELLQGLEIGQVVPVWSVLRDVQLEGRLAEIGRGASVGSVLYPLVVSLDAQVMAGEALEVGLQPVRADGLSVPLAAVMRSAEGLSVFRLAGERVERVGIAVAGFEGERALIGEGALAAGDQVVYAGLSRLADGDSVELLP